MAAYRFLLINDDQTLQDEQVWDCPDDDAAIDRAGDLDHRGEIRVYRLQRLVAHFPPWRGQSFQDRPPTRPT